MTPTTVPAKLVTNEPTILDFKDEDDFQCDCVPMFRLTRIKHAQDFSDTFLLEVRVNFFLFKNIHNITTLLTHGNYNFNNNRVENGLPLGWL